MMFVANDCNYLGKYEGADKKSHVERCGLEGRKVAEGGTGLGGANFR
jgi:hypothetical protein